MISQTDTKVLARPADFVDFQVYHQKVAVTPQRVDRCPIASAHHFYKIIDFGNEG